MRAARHERLSEVKRPGVARSGAPRPRTPSRRVALQLALLSVGLSVGGLGLLGLPGALWLTLARPVAALFATARMPGDSAWPMAIVHSLLWPLFLPPACLLAAKLAAPGRGRVGCTLLLTAAAAVALGVAFQVLGGLLP